MEDLRKKIILLHSEKRCLQQDRNDGVDIVLALVKDVRSLSRDECMR